MTTYTTTVKEKPQYLHALGIGVVAVLVVIALASPRALQLTAQSISQFLTWGEIPHQDKGLIYKRDLFHPNQTYPAISVHSNQTYLAISVSPPDGSVTDFLIIPETSGLLIVILFSIIMVPTMGLLKGHLWFKTSWLLLGIAVGLLWGITRMTLIITTAYLFGSDMSSILYYILVFFDIPWVVVMWSTGVSFLKREKLEEPL